MVSNEGSVDFEYKIRGQSNVAKSPHFNKLVKKGEKRMNERKKLTSI